MRRQLVRAYWIGNILLLFFMLIFAGFMIYSDIQSDMGSLRAILNTASAWTSEASSNLQDLADKIADSAPPLRVRYIMPNGILLADSGSDETDTARLLQQPEVVDALRQGTGDDLSFANSILHPAINAAMLLDNRLLLHLENPIEEIMQVITIYLPMVLLMFLVMVAVSRLLMNPVTKKMVHQLTQVRYLLEGATKSGDINTQEVFSEIRPSMENIIYLIDRMRYDLEQISKTRDMQRDFVDNSSHELKSPLTSITGFAEMLKDDPDLPPDQREEFLGYILAECERMAGIINDILLLEKHDARLPKDLPLVELSQVASKVAVALQPQAAQKEITISVTGQLTVRAVEQDMWDLLRNLMGNAVRYGRQGGWVKVILDEQQLQVCDNGVGIAPEHHTRIFEKFYRTDSARDREDGGTGLGLAIVAGITNRYGASISVDSALGKGSCFVVSFVRKM